MKLKASCDVESIDDFAKYYERAFVRTRDDRVAHIEMVRRGTGQVIVGFPSGDPNHVHESEVAVLQWPDVQQMLVFGKVQGGIIYHHGALYYVFQGNNRVSTRGYREGEFSWNHLAADFPVRDRLSAVERSDDRQRELLAWSVLYPQYSPFISWTRTHQILAVSPLWCMHRERGHDKIIVRRRQRVVGIYEEDRRSIGMFPTEYKMYQNTLVRHHGVACHELS